ncbi:MAG: hypothetical protein ACSHXB_17600 [Sulfitobacter sp.]
MNGFCRRLRAVIVTDRELDNSDFLRDVRNFAVSLNIKPWAWLKFLDRFYLRWYGWVSDEKGREIFFDLGEFERDHIEDWFERFCCTPCPENITPRIQARTRKRVRIVATLLRAKYPDAALMWGVRAANDNGAPR